MGDAGTLARLNVQVRRHNLIGDTTWCRGRVAAKTVLEARGEVTLDLVAVNQRDETIAQGQAVVVLPRRSLAPREGARHPSSTRSEEHTSELQSPCNLVCR